MSKEGEPSGNYTTLRCCRERFERNSSQCLEFNITLSPTEAFHGPIVTQNVMMNSSLNSFGMQPGCLGQHKQTVVMTTSIGLVVSEPIGFRPLEFTHEQV